jgi:hypothetical protein
VAATWSRSLAYARGEAMGSEHRGKGVDVQLGPVCGPLGRFAEGGRNWVSLYFNWPPPFPLPLFWDCLTTHAGRIQP